MPKASNDYDFDGFEGLNLKDPEHDQSAATKKWTEDQIAAAGGASSGFTFQNLDSSDGQHTYVGYKHPDGRWYIYRRTLTSGAYQKASGASGYTTAWTERAGLTYA